ncbi:hypothetical protein V1264_022205 [Littorina saxatilis]|uniref:Uncharacterized protein n=1 Tax=Littorina saxatilis TaxID=31220 RepID=A0AAN9AK48_9CAEN
MPCSDLPSAPLLSFSEGQERFRSMTSSYFRGAHGCLLLFNVTNEETFNSIINWFNDLHVYAPPENICCIIVGVSTNAARSRVVTAERAFRLAESLGLTYCETQVKDEQMVLWILTRVVNSVIVSRARRQSLAITIMPNLQQHLQDKEKKRWKCCSS